MSITDPGYDLPEGYTHIYSGKVRDLYRTPDDRLLFVASDRISAYDWILATPIPDKGRILTAMSLWWFDRIDDIVPHHVISTRVPDAVARRGMICANLDMFPVECVVRGSLAGSGLADDRDLILADTKFEFGTQADGTIVLADEILTPDSSRYWPADGWEPGHPQPSFDKQYVRDWLTSPESGWDRHSGQAPPPLPDEVVEKTRQKYIEAYERLTGKRFN